MSDKVFLDTHIFVYSFDQTAPHKAATARQLISQSLQNGSGVVSFQVVQEFFNVALKRFSPPFSVDDAERYFVMVFRPLLAVHSSPSLYLRALKFRDRYRLSWYDSLIIAGAVEAGCRSILTEDLQHGMTIEGMLVQNPFLSSTTG